MNNKVLVNIKVPEIDRDFDVYLPINKKIGNIVNLLNKSINEISGGIFPISNTNKLYNIVTKKVYKPDELLLNTDIRNGSTLFIIS